MLEWISKWLKKYKWYSLVTILGFIIPPFLLQWLMTSIFGQTSGGTDDGWLGFWGGYLGSVIAIGGVYWQSTKQSRLSKEQLYNEKENQYRQARPFFILSKVEKMRKEVSCYCSEKIFSKDELSSAQYISIDNVSKKDMYAVKVIVSTDEPPKDVRIPSSFISDFGKFNSVANLINKENYNSSVSISKISNKEKVYLAYNESRPIQQVWIWYITEIRESIKLYFECLPEDNPTFDQKYHKSWITYIPAYKQLENQKSGTGETNPAIYELKDFQESKRINLK